jgi:chromosome segregation ATPase
MLIIMHQNMVEQFSVLSNIEKLHMVEAAVGLEPFRENVLAAKEKLTKILSQEESVTKLLESAEQTLNYWREQYEKFQEKKQLELKRRFLDRELAWAEVERRENMVTALEANHAKHQDSLGKIEKEKQAFNDQLCEQQNSVVSLKGEEKAVFNQRIVLERGIAEKESTIAFVGELLKEAKILEATVANTAQFKLLRSENLQALVQDSKQQIVDLSEQVKGVEERLLDLEQAQEKVKGSELDKRVHLALLEFKRANAVVSLKEIETSLAEAQANLKTAEANARAYGERIESDKSASEIQDEIRLTEGHLAALCKRF